MRTIWLASYPKSGNTWMRMLIANLMATDAGPVDINNLPESAGIASGRGAFDHWLLVESGLLTHDEVDQLRPRLHELLANGIEMGGELDGRLDGQLDDDAESPVRFIKVHDAYARSPNGEPLLAGARGADGAIVVVRDPRDIVSSLANHNGMSLDQAITFMNDTSASVCGKLDRIYSQFRQRLFDWSTHVASWLDQTDIPVYVVRYEDLKNDTLDTFRRALAFAGRAASPEELERAVRFAGFDELKRQEQEHGFGEAPVPSRDRGFFRRGVAGGWRDELTPDQVAKIEAAHAPMMARLGYALSDGKMELTTSAGWADSAAQSTDE